MERWQRFVDGLFVAGFGLVVAGVACIYWPVAVIIAGAGLMGAAVLLAHWRKQHATG